MRKIVIEDVRALDGEFTVIARLWLEVPPKRLLGPQASALPQFGASAPWGITDAELSAFSKGVLTERTFAPTFLIGTSLEQVQDALQSEHVAQQEALTKTVENTPDVAGKSWDGSSWDAKPDVKFASAEAALK